MSSECNCIVTSEACVQENLDQTGDRHENRQSSIQFNMWPVEPGGLVAQT